MLDILALLECYNTYDQDDIYFDVAKAMLENYNQLQTSSIQQFAESNHISVSTVSRFMRQMYYDNFSSFRMIYDQSPLQYQYDGKYYPALKDEDIDPVAYGEMLAEKIKETTSRLDEQAITSLLSMIESSEEIVFIGIPLHSEIWRLQVELVLLGKKTNAFIDPNYQVKAIDAVNEKSAVISLIYMPQYNLHQVQQLKRAKEKGAQTACIAHVRLQGIENIVDLSLQYEGTGTQVDSLLMQVLLNYIGLRLRNKLLLGKR